MDLVKTPEPHPPTIGLEEWQYNRRKKAVKSF